MDEIIIHHYPPSPVSEKIRMAMGLKKLSWRSVEQNRLPDRPELFALTGGYRRIPVMQIGADVYCDTHCILRELESRFPKPTFFPNGAGGLPFALGQWTDGVVFDLAVRVAFAPAAASLPAALVQDRARLYLGPNGDFEQEIADLPHTLAQLRAQFGLVEARLESGRTFILGDNPGMPDLMIWYLFWFVRGRYAEADTFFSEFPKLLQWAERVEAIGHGTPTDMTPKESLAAAAAAQPVTVPGSANADPRDPQKLAPGMTVGIVPVTDSGDPEVFGTISAIGRDTIAISRAADSAGQVCVHFPRLGYRVRVANG